MAIRIITDSTSDIPKDLKDKYGIIALPLTVHFGEEEYKDGVDITPEEFFEKLVKSKGLPSTSQVNPIAFETVYKNELEKGNKIISIHISSELSGTYQSASIAKQSLGNSEDIMLIDSRGATLSLGMVVLKAAELANKGMEPDDIVNEIEEYKKKVRILIVVDTLEYLKKGGRLSGTQAAIGGMLNIKPILTIEDGKVVSFEKARGHKKAVKRMLELMKEKRADVPEGVIGLVNAKTPETTRELKELIIEEFGQQRFVEAEVGSVIATHVGPGAYGIVFIES